MSDGTSAIGGCMSCCDREGFIVNPLFTQWQNDCWSVDFVADQFIDGRRLRIFVVVDDCTRECLALIADTSISGIRVARELDRLLAERGTPKTIVSDNGTEADLERYSAMGRRS